MTFQPEQYPYVSKNPTLGASSFFPFLPLTLTYQQRSVQVPGLLDSAATVNVLPYDVGQQLGAVWNNQTVPIQLTGNLAKDEARGIVLLATVGKFPPVDLAFAWTKNNQVPLLLGQVNFFMEFEICFFRSLMRFEVKPK